MAKKFDTNPLDPHFPEKAKAAAQTGPAGGYTAPQTPYKTAEFPSAPGSITEEETRKFQEADFQAYSAYAAPQAGPLYQTTNFAGMNQASSRKVEKVGLSENVLTALSYVPLWIGFVAALVQLLIVPKSEAKVRFHAAQGLAAHIAIFAIGAILEAAGNLVPFTGFAGGIFWIVTTVMLIVFAIKAWRGKPVHIEAVDDLTNWLEEKISLKNE